jgi:radical SAM superfamily enzyme YgiQ (UPF0313 family)
MRIRFLMPSGKGWLGQVHKSGKTGIPRISLTLLAALTPDKYKIELIDTRFKEPGYDDPPDMVAISSFTNEIQHAYKMADEFRRRGSKVVMGGIHVSMLPDEALEHADCVVIGEAETTWPKVLEDFENGNLKPIYKIEGFNDLVGLPIARRDLLEKNRYFSISSLQATRGCPFDCSFCTVTIFNGRKIRMRPIKEVVKEIEMLPDKHNIMFLDDNIAANFEYAKKLFTALEPLKIRWSSQVSFNCAKDPELLQLMQKSGCDFVLIGFESVYQDSLNDSRKGRWVHVEKYAEGIRALHGYHINIIGSFVVGLDHDTKDIFPETLKFIMDNSIDAVIINILTPYPGTVLYREDKMEGRIFDRDWSNYCNSNVVYYPKKMSPAELMDGYYWLMHELYKPINVIRRVFKRKRNLKSRFVLNLSYYHKTKRYPRVKWDDIGKVSQYPNAPLNS